MEIQGAYNRFRDYMEVCSLPKDKHRVAKIAFVPYGLLSLALRYSEARIF